MRTPFFHRLASGMLLVAVFFFPFLTHAGDEIGLQQPAYFISGDANGIQQVWRLSGSSDNLARLTNAPTNVVDFGVSKDSANLAYTSDGKLWLQSNAPDATARELVDLSGSDPAHPIFSPNGNQIAYTDNGIWVMNIADGSSRQYTNNEFASDMGVYTRYFEPRVFTANGAALVVNIGVWEGETVAILNLTTGSLDELENLIHTDALPLSDGRLLVYGNNQVAGEFNLQLAEGGSLQNRTELLNFYELEAGLTLYADQAVELRGGVVRIVGTALEDTGQTLGFYFDFNVTSKSMVGNVVTFPFAPSEGSGYSSLGAVTRDGSAVAMYANVVFTARNVPGGRLVIRHLEEGRTGTLDNPSFVAMFQ